MDIFSILILGASAVVSAVGVWLTTMAMEGQAPTRARARVRVEAEREDL